MDISGSCELDIYSDENGSYRSRSKNWGLMSLRRHSSHHVKTKSKRMVEKPASVPSMNANSKRLIEKPASLPAMSHR